MLLRISTAQHFSLRMIPSKRCSAFIVLLRKRVASSLPSVNICDIFCEKSLFIFSYPPIKNHFSSFVGAKIDDKMLLYPIFLHKVSYKNRAKTLKKRKKVPFVEQILPDRVSNRLQ
jgi:hypothetical protein